MPTTPDLPSQFTFSAAVNSSTVKGIAYSEQNKTLAVNLWSGLNYIYTNVPKNVAVAFLGAESVGSFFVKEIKGYYSYLKVGLQDQSVFTEAQENTETPVRAGNRSNLMNEFIKDLVNKGVPFKEAAGQIYDYNRSFVPPLNTGELDPLLDKYYGKERNNTQQVAAIIKKARTK